MKVGLWIRVSSDMQVRDESPEVHLKRAQDYAKDRGWEVVETYRLDGISGGHIWDLPITRKMLYHVKTGRIQGLVFTSLERLGRDTLELLQFEKYFRDREASLISIFDNIDTSTSDGKRYFQGLAAQAEYERAKLSERIRRGIQTRFKKGEVFTKNVPFGYMKENKKLVINPDESPIVELIFKLFLHNHSYAATAKELNSRGYRTRTGGQFSPVYIFRVVTSTAVMGKYYANRTAKVKKKVAGKITYRTEPKPREQWIEFDVAPIISKEDFERAQAIVSSFSSPGKRSIHAYSGILRCHDGTLMYHRRGKGPRGRHRYWCRKCNKKILASELDQAVGSIIESFALNKLPQDAVIETSSETEIKQQLLKSVKAELQRIERKQDKLIELYTDDAISLPDFKKRKEPLEKRQHELEQERAAIEYEFAESEGQERAKQKLFEALDEISWTQIEGPIKNELLSTFVKSITLKGGEIVIHLLYVPRTVNISEVCNLDRTHECMNGITHNLIVTVNRPSKRS